MIGSRTAPIQDAPILSASQVLEYILQGEIMLTGRSTGKSGQESHSKSDVNTNNNICIYQLTKYLSIAEANLFLKGAMFWSVFRGTRYQLHESI